MHHTRLIPVIFTAALAICAATSAAAQSTPETAAYSASDSTPVTTYTTTYHANGGYWWGNPSTSTKTLQQQEGQTYQVIDAKPSFGAYTFTGWNTEPDGSGDRYIAYQQYVCTGNLDLYAQWGAPQGVVVPTATPNETPVPTTTPEPTATAAPTPEPTVTPVPATPAKPNYRALYYSFLNYIRKNIISLYK